MKKASNLLITLCALLAGCSTTRLTNLTPGKVPRNPSGIYPFEATWKSKRLGSDRKVEAFVLVDGNAYAMKPVPGTKERWEAQVPIAADKTAVPYHYKFNFTYPGAITTHGNSDLSPSYRLHFK